MTSGLSGSGGRVGRHRPRPWLCGRRIVLACAGPEVPPSVAVARDLRLTADTVRKWRRRFLAERLDGLVDEPRPGRPPTISVDQVVVVVTTLEQLPKNATYWSRTSMARHSGLSKSTVGRIWRQFQPAASGGLGATPLTVG